MPQDSREKKADQPGGQPEANLEPEFVYDLEVEDNHNFFANGLLVSNCDEMGFLQDDMELYDAAVPSLATTGGKFIGASTPGPIDSLFYLMCTDDQMFGDVSRHHVSWRDALEPNGPLDKDTLEVLRRQMVNDQWRWIREMEAEFSVSSDVWIPLEMVNRCVDETLEYLPASEIYGVSEIGSGSNSE